MKSAGPLFSASALQDELDELPVHGPGGRIQVIRKRLGLRQLDFARAVGVVRESVSHWENVDPETGEPRQRTAPRSGAAVAALVQARLGYELRPDTFFEHNESPLERLVRRQEELHRLIELVLRRLDDLHVGIRAPG